MAGRSKPIVRIVMDGQEDSYLKSYTTRDEVKGTVMITAPMDCRFEEIYITLEGQSTSFPLSGRLPQTPPAGHADEPFTGWTMTYVDNTGAAASVNTRIRGYHKHLCIRQPIDEALYPHPRIAERDRTYEFPFSFVIPEELPITSCRHSFANDQVLAEHKKLPPSLGDPSQAGHGQTLLDDLAPHMSKVIYAVRVRVTTPRKSDCKEIDLVDIKQRFRLVPEVEEHPPVNVEDNDDDNVLRKERVIKKGIFHGRLGWVTAEAVQPSSLMLPPPRAVGSMPATTNTIVKLRFDPAQPHLQPPKLSSVTNRLKVSTYYAAEPMGEFPARDKAIYSSTRGLYAESIKLSSRCVGAVRWTRNDVCSGRQQDGDDRYSHISDDDAVPSPSAHYASGVYYTAKIVVPVSLPKDKAWVPTFYSCLVSRIYQLEVSISLTPPNASILPSTISLRIPIQISAAGNPRPPPMPLFSDDEVTAFFSPRNATTPPAGGFADDEELASGSLREQLRGSISSAAQVSQPPPGYSFLAGASHGVPVRIPSPYGISPGCG